ncbi:MAG TPA: hypothetical protein VH063_02770 [Gaiellaceae bacterium]|nr:hypothetical protein [Gaiellaceae bacterium]
MTRIIFNRGRQHLIGESIVIVRVSAHDLAAAGGDLFEPQPLVD